MRTVKITFSILLLCVIITQAQGWGNQKKIVGDNNLVTKSRNLSDYDHIEVHNNLDVILISGTEGNISIKAESNLIPYITTKIDSKTLEINIKKGYYLKPTKNNKLTITVPFIDINKVSLSGSGNVYSDTTIKATDFDTAVSGSGDIKLTIEAKNLKSNVTGSGDIELNGSTEHLKCRVTGSGGLKAYNLTTKNVDAAVTGSGDIEITATHSLKARITGSGDIEYKGNPEREDKAVTGSGDITKK